MGKKHSVISKGKWQRERFAGSETLNFFRKDESGKLNHKASEKKFLEPDSLTYAYRQIHVLN